MGKWDKIETCILTETVLLFKMKVLDKTKSPAGELLGNLPRVDGNSNQD